MKNRIIEKVKYLDCTNIQYFYDDVCKIVNYIEPSFDNGEIMHLIKSRDQEGDGLVSDDSLIIHVISKKVKKNQAIYCYLRKTVSWHSSVTDLSARLNKAVILMVAPDLKNGELINLEDFIEDKRIDRVENLVMR